MSALRDDFFQHYSSGGQGRRSQGEGCEEGGEIEHFPTARLLIVRKK